MNKCLISSFRNAKMQLLCKWKRGLNGAIFFILIITFIPGTLYIWRRLPQRNGHFRLINHLQPDHLPVPPSSHLVDLRNFTFPLLSDICDYQDVYLLTLVHSTPTHVKERKAIRSTWGAVNQVSGRSIRTVFLAGKSLSPKIQHQLQIESSIYKDIVQGNFIDSYANLTYKNVMGLKWALTYCNSSRFILKVDEDAYVDILQFVKFMLTVYGDNAMRVLMCHVFPEGTPALRQGKWTVPVVEYPYSRYPRYCAGLAYVLSFDVIRDLVIASERVPFFWIDDVYVTGLLAEVVSLRHLSMNFRITLDAMPLKRWLKEDSLHQC
uniref:Hexosyltransferase n=1 Tax=Strigamia maritima TaxID=126957 RepID=T1JHM9_STRMM